MKYGSGVGMKDVMRMEMDEVVRALDRAAISDESRETVTDALREAFYQWAWSNAIACAFDEEIRARLPEEDYMDAVKAVIHGSRIMEKFAETYPEAWMMDEDEDDEVCEDNHGLHLLRFDQEG